MLRIKNLSKTFNTGTENEATIFSEFYLNIKMGETTALLGANGCGKSTLFNIISGVITPDSGELVLNDQRVNEKKENERAIHIGRVYQDPSMGVSPSLTILENIALADKKGQNFGLKRLVRKSKIKEYKELLSALDLGLENKLNTQVKFLSGGQRQSLSLLMATMKKPELLLLDEHTAALDPKTSKLIMEKTQKLVKANSITTIMISHNIRDAIKYSDRIIMLSKGRIVLDVASSDITETELVNIYNQKSMEPDLQEVV